MIGTPADDYSSVIGLAFVVDRGLHAIQHVLTIAKRRPYRGLVFRVYSQIKARFDTLEIMDVVVKMLEYITHTCTILHRTVKTEIGWVTDQCPAVADRTENSCRRTPNNLTANLAVQH